MDAFSYLSVLLSIILGLGITQLLTGLGQQIQHRRRVRRYGPALVWAVLLLLVHVQTWWTMFELRAQEAWTFAAFLVVLLQPVVLYLLSALVLPDVGQGEAVDLRAHYYAQARWFFGLFAALLVVSLVKDLVLRGALPVALNVAFHVVFLAMAGVGAFSRREGVHRALAAATVLLLSAYISVLFSRLA